MVATYLAAHRGQMPAEAWARRAQEWTPEMSAQGWARTLGEIAAVYALYVSTSHQGHGLGRRLVQAVATEVAQRGMTALQIGFLAANAPAWSFYEAIGGHLIGERLFGEDSIMLPEVVYEWVDITVLVAPGQPEERRQP